MRTVFRIILISCLFLSFQRRDSQFEKINLSYNILDNSLKIRKYFDREDCANFYIGNEHFKAIDKAIQISKEELNSTKLISIEKFIKISNKKRQESINAEKKKGIIKILSNSEIFGTIYLYEKSGEEYFKYKVNWIEEIID